MQAIGPVGRNKTLYASRTDKALKASRWFWQEPPAGLIVGDAGPTLAQGVESIDITAAGENGPLDFMNINHDVYAKNVGVITHMRSLLDDAIDLAEPARFFGKKICWGELLGV